MARTRIPMALGLAAGLALAGAAAGSGTAQPAPVVVVFDIETKRLQLDAELLAGLGDHLATLLTRSGRYQVVPRAEVKSRLKNQQRETYKKCYDQSCQVAIGRELAAEKTVSTQIMRLGERCTVNITIYDLQRATTEAAASRSAGCGEQAVVESLEGAAAELCGGRPPPQAAAERTERRTDDEDKGADTEAKVKRGLLTAVDVGKGVFSAGKVLIGGGEKSRSERAEQPAAEPGPSEQELVRGPRGETVWLRCPLGQRPAGERCTGQARRLTFAAARSACPGRFKLPTAEQLLALMAPCDAAVRSGGSGHCTPCSAAADCAAVFGDDSRRYWTFSWDPASGTIRTVELTGSVGAARPEERFHVRCVRALP